MTTKLDDIESISTGHDSRGGWVYVTLTPAVHVRWGTLYLGDIAGKLPNMRGDEPEYAGYIGEKPAASPSGEIKVLDPSIRPTNENPFPEAYNVVPLKGVRFALKTGYQSREDLFAAEQQLKDVVLPVLAEHLGVEQAQLDAKVVGKGQGR